MSDFNPKALGSIFGGALETDVTDFRKIGTVRGRAHLLSSKGNVRAESDEVSEEFEDADHEVASTEKVGRIPDEYMASWMKGKKASVAKTSAPAKRGRRKWSDPAAKPTLEQDVNGALIPAFRATAVAGRKAADFSQYLRGQTERTGLGLMHIYPELPAAIRQAYPSVADLVAVTRCRGGVKPPADVEAAIRAAFATKPNSEEEYLREDYQPKPEEARRDAVRVHHQDFSKSTRASGKDGGPE